MPVSISPTVQRPRQVPVSGSIDGRVRSLAADPRVSSVEIVKDQGYVVLTETPLNPEQSRSLFNQLGLSEKYSGRANAQVNYFVVLSDSGLTNIVFCCKY